MEQTLRELLMQYRDRGALTEGMVKQVASAEFLHSIIDAMVFVDTHYPLQLPREGILPRKLGTRIYYELGVLKPELADVLTSIEGRAIMELAKATVASHCNVIKKKKSEVVVYDRTYLTADLCLSIAPVAIATLKKEHICVIKTSDALVQFLTYCGCREVQTRPPDCHFYVTEQLTERFRQYTQTQEFYLSLEPALRDVPMRCKAREGMLDALATELSASPRGQNAARVVTQYSELLRHIPDVGVICSILHGSVRSSEPVKDY